MTSCLVTLWGRSIAVLGVVLALAVALAPHARAANVATADRARMTALVNLDRARAGRARLVTSAGMQAYAQRHAQAMAARQKLYHSQATRYGMAENVGYTWGGDVTSVNAWLMRSRPHRWNILAKHYRYLGVGVARRGRYVWVTEVFR